MSEDIFGEGVTCFMCDGDGTIDEITCERCQGAGWHYYEKEQKESNQMSETIRAELCKHLEAIHYNAEAGRHTGPDITAALKIFDDLMAERGKMKERIEELEEMKLPMCECSNNTFECTNCMKQFTSDI